MEKNSISGEDKKSLNLHYMVTQKEAGLMTKTVI